MQLVGMLDSPFVRRVAISARLLGLSYTQRSLSIFRHYAEFRELNPMVKVPTLVCDDGTLLVDSTLIIEHLEFVSGKSLMPNAAAERQAALRIIGAALVAMEKVVQLIYETKQRPPDYQFAAWIDRLKQQLVAALDLLEESVADGQSWFFSDELTQADVTSAVAWRFVRYVFPELIAVASYPGLAEFSSRAEALPEFIACPLD